MVFLRSPFAADPLPAIESGSIILRTPRMEDYAAWARLRAKSRAFLEPWEPSWPHDDLTSAAFRLRVKRYNREIRDDLSYPFFILRRGDSEFLGALTLSNIRRGAAQMASLGYWIGEPFAKRGHMFEAVRAVLPFAFGHLHLHRVEAACLPTNIASIALLQKCGFQREGIARSYLKINGKWQDHLLFALLAGDVSD
jgi:[ribosomal protein S5]-alanine N-acetyltransferase